MTQCKFEGIIVARETPASLFEYNTLENLRKEFKKYGMCKDLRESELLESTVKRYSIVLILNENRYSSKLEDLCPYRCCLVHGLYPTVKVGHPYYELVSLLHEFRVSILKVLKSRNSYSEKNIITEAPPRVQPRDIRKFLNRLAEAGVLKPEMKTKEVYPNIYQVIDTTYELDCNIIFL